MMPDDGIARSAVFSQCRNYRYTLDRVWGNRGTKKVTWILLNPATADATQDDLTNKKGIKMSKEWGYDQCAFVNLFAYRTPDPETMLRARDPVGPDNDLHIHNECCDADIIILAWGRSGGRRGRARAKNVLANIWGHRDILYCIGRNQDGSPKHPARLGYSKMNLERWWKP